MFIRYFLRAAALAAGLLTWSLQAQAQISVPLPSAPPANAIINLQGRQTSGQLTVPVDKSQLLHVDQAFGEISVGNKDIADVVPLSRNLVYVLGKKRGATNFTISDQGGNIVAIVDVLVTFDADSLRRSLGDVLPEEKVTVKAAGDSLVLTGLVSSADRLRQVTSIAERYAPGAVTNLLSLGASQQVLLQVRFAEVQRSALTDLGANFSFAYVNGNLASALVSGKGTPATAFGAATATLTDNLLYDL